MLYMVAPIIIVPLWARHVANWWFLVGIAISYVASLSAGSYSRSIFIFACFCIGFWVRNGFSFYHYTTFYFFCAMCGYILWQVADTVRTSCARQSLVKSAKVFEEAIAQNRLRIVQLDSSQDMIMTAEDISFSTTDKFLLPLKPLLTVLVISNNVAEAFTYIFGVFTGLAGVVRARAKGIDNLTSKEADSIIRQLKKGTVGLTVLMLGYFGVNSIYCYVLCACYVGLVLRSVIGTAKKS